MAASFEPILGSGVDIGEAIGGVSASDIPPALGISPAGIDKPEGLPPPPERGPRINSINLSSGTAIKNSLCAVCNHLQTACQQVKGILIQPFKEFLTVKPQLKRVSPL
jgi:hypothetical protein